MQKIIKYILLVGVFYYLLNGLDLKKITDAFLNYSIPFTLLTMLSVVLSDLLLAKRWRGLSRNHFSLKASFEAIGISAFLNFILPAKLGEISKIVYLKKVYGFNTNNTFSILILERVFDVMFLGFFSFLTAVLFLDDQLILESSIIFFFLVVLFFLLVKSKSFKKLLKKIKYKVIRVNVLKIVSNLNQAINLKIFLKVFTYTVLVWLSYFLTVYLFLEYVADFKLTLLETLIVFVISSIAMSLPLLPGGVGAYQAGIVFALGLYNIGKEEALIAGVMLHIFMLIPSFFIAVIVLNGKDISLEIFKRKKD